MALRTTVRQKLLKTIEDSSFFDSFDFEITEYPASKKATADIVYVHNKKYLFRLEIPKTPKSASYDIDYQIKIAVTPGALAIEETRTLKDEDRLFEAFKEWLSNLRMEIEAVPLARRGIENSRVLDELLERVEDVEITPEILHQFLDRIEKLEAELVQHVTTAIENHKEQEAKLKELGREFDALRAKASTSAKQRSLARLVGGLIVRLKLDKLFAKLLENGVTEIVDKYLPPGPS